MAVVRSHLAAGWDWQKLKAPNGPYCLGFCHDFFWQVLVREQAATGNPVAAIIEKLRLDSNELVLLLGEPLDDADCRWSQVCLTKLLPLIRFVIQRHGRACCQMRREFRQVITCKCSNVLGHR